MNSILATGDDQFFGLVREKLDQLDSRAEWQAVSREAAHAFIGRFLSRTAPGDLALHTPQAWAALSMDLVAFMQRRPGGRPRVRVFNPEDEHRGWEGKYTVLQVVTDDMPFLVDSISMAVDEAGAQLHAIIHPVLGVRRDSDGTLQALDEHGANAESVMHLEIDRLARDEDLKALAEAVEHALMDVRAAVGEWGAMRQTMLDVADDLHNRRLPLKDEDITEASAFLRWVADDHFTFLGYREYEIGEDEGDEVLRALKGSGMGILHDSERSVAPRSLRTLAASELPQSGAMDAIILTKTNARSTVHRPGHMDYIGVLRFDESGRPVAEQRFLGLFTSSAYMCRPQEVPLIRDKCEEVLKRSGLKRDAYSGKTLRHILEVLPRDELFQGTEDELYAIATGILDLRERARARLFVRRDKYGRFFSCLAFVPRDRFNTHVRESIEAMLGQSLRGEHLDSTVLMGESALVRLHVTVRPAPGDQPEYDPVELEGKLVHLVRNWHDELGTALVDALGERQGLALAQHYGRALPAGYIEEVTPEVAAEDVRALASLDDDDAVRMSFYRSAGDNDQLRFKIYRRGGDIALSEVLPQLENLGLRVLAEHVYEARVDGVRLFVQDFEVCPVGHLSFDVDQVGDRFERAFEHVWRGHAENDGFNRLVLGAMLDWRQVAMLRAYCKYLQQVGIAFSQAYMEETLHRYPGIAGLLVELFYAKFDPRRESLAAEELEQARTLLRREMEVLVPDTVRSHHAALIDDMVAALDKPRQDQEKVFLEAIALMLDTVASLDDERILRSYIDVMDATLRTSYFQYLTEPRAYTAYKFDSHKVPGAPKPVPYREIFVYGPRVEGVHLRFGPVARGGLRWSDRREDFRTEVLGLVKAQMVKNTVIVPVGSKGGFFVKRPPESGEREAVQAEGIACYSMFINGLLDITDNLVEGKVVPPRDVVRHDADDPYLVVAADKGTATFSDIANSIAIEHGYWLADAFASGGSNGYDHKKMGITAKGAWESVKRHFRALGRDSQAEDFTCVGVGDMSGDVFGNGMLLSRHIRLLAAFDHRHIFLDPNPDAAASFAERERMFALPRSTWEDYDKSLISEGGGVYARSLKAIPVSEQVRKALGLKSDVSQLSPPELISAILKAPVDLLWNGGIGTYVKASSETHEDAGDRTNNVLRVDGRDLRCKVVGEGGNLGLTQRGRIEAAQQGVLLNTDFIDNSAGVDTSDHEVNIKILLGDAVQRGELSMDKRNEQLAAMTDEVERLVLWDNYRQNYAITLMEHQSVKRLGSMAHFISTLEAEGLLDRQVEFLPSDAELSERKTRGQGLTRPELSVLLSYDKIKLFQQLLESDVPEDPYLSKELARYFPEPLREPYAEHMQRHRLRREIIATAVTNSTLNRMGATFMMRMQEDTGQGPAAIAKAFTAAREILDARALWAQIEALDGKVAEDTQIDAMLQIWTLLRHMTRWLLSRPGGTLDIAANVERYAPGVSRLREALPGVLTPTSGADFDLTAEKWEGLGLDADLAQRLARMPVLREVLDMVDVARETDHPIDRVAAVFFELAETLDLEWLRGQIEALPVDGRWHAQARGSLLDELSTQQRALVVQVLHYAGSREDVSPVEAWLDRDSPALAYTRSMLAEILQQNCDYPIASVAVRRLAQLAHTPA
ncbi:NAD-glutamate dehydrogenase [Oleiagrimonas sp. C23AA]|uniref:NAD-glutamate dehydrogenase n=1 Tax=Oleiagrimonas sp. C23AA TaxID=2719047 RepID=UPI00141F1990|nr:NAD-glutamate dehydrogenase [Oleiagrimonas sp. C23AA]NII10247.1 NAD-glutamate dehydrogenase [Oleiagrimonas sp. C23AA]